MGKLEREDERGFLLIIFVLPIENQSMFWVFEESIHIFEKKKSGLDLRETNSY